MHEGHRERMWDRLYFHGESMSDHELLETLLFFVIPRKNTNPVAHELIDRFGSLEALFSAGPAAIEQVSGVGRKSAEFVHLVGLLSERIRNAKGKPKKLTNFADIASFARSRFHDKNAELMEIYCLNAGGALICMTFSTDHSTKIAVDSKSLSGLLVTVQPTTILVAHNHPSGKCEPSADDDAAVEKINQICRINGVVLNDCLIFSNGEEPFSYFHSHRFELLNIHRDTRK